MTDIECTEYTFELIADKINIALDNPYNIIRLCSHIYRKVLFSYGKCFELHTIERNRMICLDTDAITTSKVLSAVVTAPIDAGIMDSFQVDVITAPIELQFITITFSDNSKITLFNLDISSLMLLHFNNLVSVLDRLFSESIQAIIDKVNPQGLSLKLTNNSANRLSSHLKRLDEVVYENLHLFTKAVNEKEISSIVLRVKIFPEEYELCSDICLL